MKHTNECLHGGPCSCAIKLLKSRDVSESPGLAGYVQFTEKEREKLEGEFRIFLSEHGWSSEAKTACTYSFYHMLNVIEGKWKRT